MRKLFIRVLVLIVGFSACKRTDDKIIPTGHAFEANMGLDLNLVVDVGEIGGAGTKTISLDDNDLVAMKIFKATKNADNSFTVGDLYASGLFAGNQVKKGLPVELQHKYAYQICSAIFRKGEGVVKNPDRTYGAPLNIGITHVKDFVFDCEINKKMNLAGQSNDCNAVLGDRFSADAYIVADYAQETYTIPATRMAFKLKYNITNYLKGQKIKISVTTKKEVNSKDAVERVIKYVDVNGVDSEINVAEEVFNFPFIKYTNGKLLGEEKEVCVTVKIYHGEKIIKTLTKVQKIINNHQYSINIDANASDVQGLVISLDSSWDPIITDVDLEEKIDR